MMTGKRLAIAICVGGLAWAASIEAGPSANGDGVVASLAMIGSASAQTVRGEARRTARRTSRRTTRRNNYINTLPAGCVRRGAYYYCGGIYYEPVVQSGATVYIVVNP